MSEEGDLAMEQTALGRLQLEPSPSEALEDFFQSQQMVLKALGKDDDVIKVNETELVGQSTKD